MVISFKAYIFPPSYSYICLSMPSYMRFLMLPSVTSQILLSKLSFRNSLFIGVPIRHRTP